jgi:hypothetical protein
VLTGVVVALARSYAGSKDLPGGGERLFGLQGCCDGSTGRRHELAFAPCRGKCEPVALADICDSRHRNREDTVLRADASCALGKRPHIRPLDIKVVDTDGCCHGVDDGVDSTDLVEMDLLDGHAVGMRFCLGDDVEDLLCKLVCTRRELARIDDGLDLGEATVHVVMLMIVFMFVVVMVVVTMLVFVLMIVVMVMLVPVFAVEVVIEPCHVVVVVLLVELDIEVGGHDA